MKSLKLNETTTLIQDRLKLIYIQRPGYLKKYAMITFPIGGLHRAYEKNGKPVYFPSGAAHFLEHKCFENDGEELTAVFAAQGANVNAFTSQFQTSYLFEATDELIPNIQSLLDLVFFPKFTESGVEEEKGIITEEWASSQDNPFYQQYHTLLKTLYENHPFADDIIGDETSIQAMDYATLKAIHEAFYQPEVATLIISGDGAIEPLVDTLNQTLVLPEKTPLKPLPIAGATPPVLNETTLRIPGDVYADYWLKGIRLDVRFANAKDRYQFYLALEVGLDMLFDRTSPWVESMQEKGLINDGFDYDLTLYPEVALIILSAQTPDDKATEEAFRMLLNDPLPLLNAGRFETQKKANIGAFIYGLDSLEGTVRNRARYVGDGLTHYDLLDMQMAITLEDVTAALTHMNAAMLSLDVVLTPRKTVAND